MSEQSNELTPAEKLREDYSYRLFGKTPGLLAYGETEILDNFISATIGMSDEELEQAFQTMTNPEWKEHPNYYLEASSDGLCFRESDTKEPFKIESNDLGYLYVYTRSKHTGSSVRTYIHRVVAQLYVPNDDPDSKTVVHHIDKNKNNNLPWNLQWVSMADHARIHSVDMPMGEDHYHAIYTETQIRKVCELLEDHPDWTFARIGEMTGVDKGTVCDVYEHSNWKHVSKDYNFKPRETLNYNSNDKIRQVCWYLKNKPDMSYLEISQKTGVLIATISLIYTGKQWQSIAEEFTPFPPRGTMDYFTPDQIREVCEILSEDNRMTYPEIEDLTGVDSQTIGRVYRGDAWTEVSKDYDFLDRSDCRKGSNNPASTHSDDVIRQICELKNEVFLGHIKMDRKQIAEKVGVPLSMVKHIIAGETRTDISSQYDWYKAKKK